MNLHKLPFLKWPALPGYFGVFLLLFLPAIHGVGQYWDWSFPFYQDHISNFFLKASDSWTSTQFGSPLGYSSDFYFRLLLSSLHFLKPEILLYLTLVTIFAAGAYGIYLITQQYVGRTTAFMAGLTVFISPPLFYKFTAGHLDYLISMVVFVFLLYFLHFRYKPNLRSAIILSLLISFVGIQIQFFIFAFIYLVFFFLFHREKFQLKQLPVLIVLPLAINIIWLSNFIFGGASLVETSTNAAKISFKNSSNTPLVSLFNLAFSKATLISHYYTALQLAAYTGLFIWLVALFLRAGKTLSKVAILLLAYLMLLLFLGTGEFQTLPLGPLTTLYPMLREVGHLSGPTIVILILLISQLLKDRPKPQLFFTLFAFICVGISAYQFVAHSQTISYSQIREQLTEFKAFEDAHKDSNDRALVYPFFNQYALNNASSNIERGLPLKNSGQDNFSAFSWLDFAPNSVSPNSLQASPQYQLVTTHNLDTLHPYNVRYIFDLSDVYHSNFSYYAPKSAYNNDSSILTNDANFLSKIETNNPGRTKRLSKHILEITDSTPRASAIGSLYSVNSTDQVNNEAKIIRSLSGGPMNFITGKPEHGYSIEGVLSRPVINDSPDDQSASQSIPVPTDASRTVVAWGNRSIGVFYTYTRGRLEIFAKNSGQLKINGHLFEKLNHTDTTPIYSGPLDTTSKYFVTVGKREALVRETTSPIKITDGLPGDIVQIMSIAPQNLIQNGSFEQGPWETQVSDCNNYDSDPQINMSLDNADRSDGNKSLVLSAIRHNACTSTGFSLDKDAQYALSYDYKGENTNIASFYLAFSGTHGGHVGGSQAISGTNWQHAAKIFSTPPGTTKGRLYLYANEDRSSDTATTNRYDAVELHRLTTVKNVKIPEAEDQSGTFDITNLASSDMRFEYKDPTAHYQNLITNGSFENGPWRKKVGDCSDYDGNPTIGMSIDSSAASSGKNSVELSATRHNACTFTSVGVKPGSTYLFSFDAKGDKGAQFGYFVGFEDTGQQGATEWTQVPGAGWHKFTKQIIVPPDAATATIYLYALESNRAEKNTIHYDNVQMIELPSIVNQYYVISEPVSKLIQPGTKYEKISQTKRKILISGATTNFNIALSESYHPKWRLQMANDKSDSEAGHFKLNNFENGWYIDVDKFCKQQKLCKQNADGSYDMELVAEFTPQRWFNAGLDVSGATLLGCLVYLGYPWYRRFQKRVGI